MFVNAKLHSIGVLVSFVGLLAAIMSSADSILNVLAICVVKLMCQGSGDLVWSLADLADGVELLGVLRRATVVVGAVSLGVAFAFPDIVELNVVGLSALLVFLPCVIMGLRKTRADVTAGFWSALVGMVAVVATIPFAPKIAFVPGIAFSGITFGLVLLLNRRKNNRRPDLHG